MSGEAAGLIQKAILAVMAEVGVIGKTRTNTGQNYQFRGIDDVVERVAPLLVKHGITCMPTNVREYVVQVRESAKGARMIHVTCIVEHTYEAADGSRRTAVTLGEAMDSGDKASNKAMSGALKYAHCEVFEIPTFGAAADTESESPELAPKAPATTKAASAPAQPPKAAPRASQGASALFPPYGSMKGKPLSAGTVKDLQWYAGNSRQNMADPSKAQWAAKEAATLAGLEAELRGREA